MPKSTYEKSALQPTESEVCRQRKMSPTRVWAHHFYSLHVIDYTFWGNPSMTPTRTMGFARLGALAEHVEVETSSFDAKEDGEFDGHRLVGSDQSCVQAVSFRKGSTY